MHLLGISQRKVKHLANKHLGLRISTKAIKDAMHNLAMHESMQINQQILDDDFIYIFLDGIWENVKGGGWDKTKSVVLCVLGIKADGTRQLIGFTLARAEDEASWTELLADIKARGLTGDNLSMATMDDSAGCKSALDKIYPRTPVQNCLAHKIRAVQRKVSYTNRAAVCEDLKTKVQLKRPMPPKP
ncbi:transposase [Candidatus Saccharibacteria bacterium]|nr:transposase [Candidatus Saccharibacteria bacterium]